MNHPDDRERLKALFRQQGDASSFLVDWLNELETRLAEIESRVPEEICAACFEPWKAPHDCPNPAAAAALGVPRT